MALETAQLIALVLLAIFANLFIFCFIVTHVRQKLRAQKKHRSWSERYQSRAQKRLENKRRIWAMFGLTYNGTIDDVRQSDDEDEEDEGARKPRGGLPAVTHIECSNSYVARPHSPPPPYIPGLAELGAKDGLWGLRSAPPGPPQRPERIHDNRRDEDMGVEIANARQQRHPSLKAPELVAPGPLRRCDTTRSTRRYSAPPVPDIAPEHTSLDMARRYVSEPPISSGGSVPPLCPRRLDSISRRRIDERD